MTTSKKKRMSMLDSLAAAGSGQAPGGPPAPPSGGGMMSSNRALRSARDAVDAHYVWELDPDAIVDDRMADRLDPEDVADLRDAIEANGQTVPILVRRHPDEAERYLLVYGRRRLEAIRQSDRVTKIRALVATLDDDEAVRAQISENMARRDLSYIEKALFAQELIESGFGNQIKVAEVLTVTKSSISMALAVVEMVGADLIQAIGPAHGIGRPRWEALGKAMAESGIDRDELAEIAETVHATHEEATVIEASAPPRNASTAAFEAVAKAADRAAKATLPRPKVQARKQHLRIDGERRGTVRRTARGVSIDLDSGPFAAWVESEAQELIDDLHARWRQRRED